MNRYAIIVAGGSGSRMGTEIPKQFLEIHHKPVLMHSISRFFDFDNHLQIIVVLPEKQIDFWERLCIKYKFNIQHQIVKGGAERFFSVQNALNTINLEGIVAIHDAVRPLVSQQTIDLAFASAATRGNGIPAISIKDSLRKFNETHNHAVNRSNYKIIQTPQCFKVSDIKKAYFQEYRQEFTDDASVLEYSGAKVYLTEGNNENIKITNPFDLKLAEFLLNS